MLVPLMSFFLPGVVVVKNPDGGRITLSITALAVRPQWDGIELYNAAEVDSRNLFWATPKDEALDSGLPINLESGTVATITCVCLKSWVWSLW